MNIEEIFELVRKEQVVLWIGSGFSLYAGYPSGQKLSEIIYQSLSASERTEISPHLSLADLAEQYVRLLLDNRKSLNALLQKEFLKQPTVKKWHETLAKIPHIKTIVTTNYDRLFELAYKDKIQPIIFPKDIASRDNRVELFKVHGDINHLDTIVITTDDYTNFYLDHKQDDLIWSVIKERVSNKHVLFIGYNLEDENVKLVFKQISKSLGDTQKQMFLIAPGFKQHNIKYLESLGISYLNFKGEAFIEKLYANIQDHITDDFSKGYISESTLRKFYKENNLTVDLKTVNNRFQISSVSSLNNAQAKVNLQFKSDKNHLKYFNEIIEGRKFGEFVIEGRQLEQFKVLLNQTNIVHGNLNEYYVKIASQPRREGTAIAVFDDGSEFEDLSYQLFISTQLLEIVIRYKNTELLVRANIDNTQLDDEIVGSTLNHKLLSPFHNSSDAISVTKLYLNISKQVSANVFVDGQSNASRVHIGKTDMPIELLENSLQFFEDLKKIERHYNVRFNNFGDFTEDQVLSVYKAIMFANNESHIQDWDDEIIWDLSKGVSLELFDEIEKGVRLGKISSTPEIVTIYGQEIQLGYWTEEPLDLYVVNLDDIKQKRSTKPIVKSRSKKVRLYYKTSTDLDGGN